jgi:hypothetical protein
MVERRLGRLARRDIVLRTDGHRWQIWIREGGADAPRHRHTEYDDEAEARDALSRELNDGRHWQKMPTGHTD